MGSLREPQLSPTKVWSIPSLESSTILRRTSRPPSPSREKLRDKDSRPSLPSEVASTVKSLNLTPESPTSVVRSSTSPSPSPTTKRTSPVPLPNSKMSPPSELTSKPNAVLKMLPTSSRTPNSKVKSPLAVTPSTLWKTRESSSRDTTIDLAQSRNYIDDIYHFK